jgi:hypothetical protein
MTMSCRPELLLHLLDAASNDREWCEALCLWTIAPAAEITVVHMHCDVL